MTYFIKENTLPKYVKEFLKSQNIEIPPYWFQYIPKRNAFDNRTKIFITKLDTYLYFDTCKEDMKNWNEENIWKKVRITFEYKYQKISLGKKAELKSWKAQETITWELIDVSGLTYTVQYFDKQRKEELKQPILKSMIIDITYL